MLLGPSGDSSGGAGGDRPWRHPPLDVVIALTILGLCLLYAVTFSHLVYGSLVEQFAPHPHPPRFAGPPHVHNPVEWFLLVIPAAVGWLGMIWSLRYLLRRGARR